MEILLVEDNPADVRMVQIAFRDCDINSNLKVVDSGEECLEYVRKQGRYADAREPDLILLDLRLPGIGGWETLRELKQDENLRLIPVVALTAIASPIEIKEAYRLHANSCIPKGETPDDARETIRQIQEYWCKFVWRIHNSAVK